MHNLYALWQPRFTMVVLLSGMRILCYIGHKIKCVHYLLLHLPSLNLFSTTRDVLTSRVWSLGPGHFVLVCLISRQLTSLQPCCQTLQLAWWPEAVCSGLVKLDVDTHWQRSVSCQTSVRQTQAAWFPKRYTKGTVRPDSWNDVGHCVCLKDLQYIY